MIERKKWMRKGTYVMANGLPGRIVHVRHHLFMDKKMVSFITIRGLNGTIRTVSADSVRQAKQVFKEGI